MTHSITAFDRKYLAPDLSKLREAQAMRRENRRIVYLAVAIIALVAFHYVALPAILHAVNPVLF